MPKKHAIEASVRRVDVIAKIGRWVLAARAVFVISSRQGQALNPPMATPAPLAQRLLSRGRRCRRWTQVLGSQECVDSVIETLVRRVDVIASGADLGAGPALVVRAITWSAAQTLDEKRVGTKNTR